MAASPGDGGAPGPLAPGRELPLRPRRREGCSALALLPLRLLRPGPGSADQGAPISTPPRVGLWVTCARKRAPLGCGCRPPEHLGEFNGVQVCRINSLQGVRCAWWRGRVSCRSLGGADARVPLRPPRSRPHPASSRREQRLLPGCVCWREAGSLWQLSGYKALFEGLGYANLLVYRRTSFI